MSCDASKCHVTPARSKICEPNGGQKSREKSREKSEGRMAESPNANESAEAAYSLQLEPYRRRTVMSEQVISRKLKLTIPVEFVRPRILD